MEALPSNAQTVAVDPFSAPAIRAAYDTAAADYVKAFGEDLQQLALDRRMIDDAARTTSPGVFVDLGCGPGVVGAYLSGRGRAVVGLDLSAAMLAAARSFAPALLRAQADMRALPLADGAAAVVVAYYSIQHVPRPHLPGVLAEVRRTLAPGGIFLVATHLGGREVVSTDFLGHSVAPFAGVLYERGDLLAAVSSAGFRIDAVEQRGPLPNEYDSQRIYVLAGA